MKTIVVPNFTFTSKIKYLNNFKCYTFVAFFLLSNEV